MGQRIDITLAELRQLRDRIGSQALEPQDFEVCGALVSNLIAKYEARIARLAVKANAAAANDVAQAYGEMNDNEACSNAEKTGPQSGDGEAHVPADDAAEEDKSTAATTTNNTKKKGDKSKSPGHGRNGAAAYTNAKHFNHQLSDGVIGSECTCGAGRMHGHRETTTIHIVGQPLFGAEAHHYDQARCRICGKVVVASGPSYVQQGIGKSVVYGYSACAMLIVMHYFASAPFKRLESLHKGWGIPLADANQWVVVEQSDVRLRPLFDTLERVGMQTATSLGIDDTGSKIIAVARQIKAEIAALEKFGESTKDLRTGINATGIYLETPNGVAILYATGLHHAGEVFDRLMKHREPGSSSLVKVTDGASKNFAHDHADNLIEAVCNAHAFLKFRALKDKYPDQYAVAGEVYAQVFDNDKNARNLEITPEERVVYHAKHSEPLMNKLKTMCLNLVRDKLVEPNSALWEPVNFVINQWPRLIQFCRKPGVPLHTNLVEQILITPVRYLAASFNYQTTHGADVGDRHMSLIASARANGVEPVAYIEHCLRNHEDLAKRPEHYLPWVYRSIINEQAKPPTVGQPQPLAA